jgi:hypothetical protein
MRNLNYLAIFISTSLFFIVLYHFSFQHATNRLISLVQNQPRRPRNLTDEDRQKILKFYNSIKENEFKKYSQNKEDGVVGFLVDFLNLSENNRTGFFVEFGTESGVEINTRHLRETRNWTGLLMDGSNDNRQINLHKEKIMHSNIVDLFRKYQVPAEFDLFSEDTDYADYWIVEEVLRAAYTPKIVIHEVNQQTPERCVTVPRPAKLTFWDSSSYHGASVCAFRCLAVRFGYTMVYCESAGVNCFWIRNDLLERSLNIESSLVQRVLTPAVLYKKPAFVYRPTLNPWVHVNCSV